MKYERPPLAVHFIWHPEDEKPQLIIQKMRQYLTRDTLKPFSRDLNIPTFFYSSPLGAFAPDASL